MQCLRHASVLGGYSKHVARQQQSFCRQVRDIAHVLSVDERSRRLGPSETKCISSAKYGGAWPDKERRVNETCQFEVDTSLDRKPVQLTQNWRDVVLSSSSSEKPSSGILDELNFADEAVRQATEQ